MNSKRLWHLHGHHNKKQNQEKSIKIFTLLKKFLKDKKHKIYLAVIRTEKNGPHYPGSWDIYVESDAVGDATLWMSENRPAGLPVFFHPVLQTDEKYPTPQEEYIAHTKNVIVFGMPVSNILETIDWSNQLDWNWIKTNWIQN